MTSLRPSQPPFGRLSEASLTSDPLHLFRTWFAQAEGAAREPGGMRYPDAVVLSTLRADGFPDGRVVLLKELSDEGFVVYTNLESAKGLAMAQHPKAALTFYWDSLGRQVRVRGEVNAVREEVADAYFASRPRESQIGAWASQQSRPITNRTELEASIAEVTARFDGRDVPRPPHWSGLCICPHEIEFWQEGEHRLHDRFVYRRDGTTGTSAWVTTRLSP